MFGLGLSVATSLEAQNAPGTGRIDGVATIATQLTKTRQRMRLYNEPGQAGTAQQAQPEPPMTQVVMYLESVRGASGAGQPKPAVMRQHGGVFAPHVLPVLAGSTVDFPNDDPFYHNVFSLSRAREFDLGRFPRGESKRVTFPKPGVVQVFCHIHADMSAYIIVLDNPWFVVPGADGRFSLENVPPGDYRLITWHERIKPMVTPVRVSAGNTTSLQLRIPLPEAAR